MINSTSLNEAHEMELETGIQGLLQGNMYVFDDHQVAKYVKWTFGSQVSWIYTVSESRK
jgi:hypothetical protein